MGGKVISLIGVAVLIFNLWVMQKMEKLEGQQLSEKPPL